MADGVAQRSTIQLGVAGGHTKDISVLSYNLLSTLKYQLQRAKFKYAHLHALHWQHRKANLLKSILDSDCDIVCLQSLDHFEEWWRPQLARAGYDGSFYARTGGIAGEGVAIFFRRKLFKLMRTRYVDMNDADKTIMSGKERKRNKLQRMHNDVSMMCALQPSVGSPIKTAILIANAYLIQYEQKPNQRFNQTIFLLKQIEEFNAPFQLPVVLCGTFYFEPASPEYCIVTTGCSPIMEEPPGPPGGVEALTPSCSSVRLRWRKPRKLGNMAITGYRVLRRAGGSHAMGFGHEVIVGADAREVVTTGLSSATIYEFCVCALTSVGQGEMSDITKPIKTLPFTKPAPGYTVLKTDLNLVEIASQKAEEVAMATEHHTGLTPRFENGHFNPSVGPALDHTVRDATHLSTSTTSVVPPGVENANQAATTTPTPKKAPKVTASSPANATTTTTAPSGSSSAKTVPSGMRDPRLVHSLNLYSVYACQAPKPGLAGGGAAAAVSLGRRNRAHCEPEYTMRMTEACSTVDYIFFSWQLRPESLLDVPDPSTLKGINPMHERRIPDPHATKPDDWQEDKWIVVPNYFLGIDEEILNPQYKGEWTPPLIDNPKSQHNLLPNMIYSSCHMSIRCDFTISKEHLSTAWQSITHQYT